MASFFTELRRRNVYKVAVAYAIVAWLLIQAASILFPTFEAPAWVMKVVITAIVLGFPVALISAGLFAYQLSRQKSVVTAASATAAAGASPAATAIPEKSIAVLPFE